MNQIEIPRYVDDPPVILLWSVDEITPLLAGLFLGIQLGQALLCTVLGLLMTHFYRKCLDASQDGFLAGFMYWYGLWSVRGRIFPNPFIREYR
ncbi:type IV conjugative transfer system protein TraL [Succinimonas amylolytica]|uniref:type IV conjugative transfer system protein TraL n=1 Tax=Succinimonas amylolytica TaxID=83769 RepID=UPI00037CB10B|nr:type IV conjugative transfer system protein TraL [Succinimonas amylolytica]